jgi:transposase
MDGIIPKLKFAARQKLIRGMQRCRDAGLKRRYLIVVNLLHHRSASETAKALGIARSTVYRVAERFGEQGGIGLLDRREDNGQLKLDAHYLGLLYDVVKSSPQDYGWYRPTWTRELLEQTMRKETGIHINVGTMSRALKMIKARRGRPKPIVGCPWSKGARTRRIRMIRKIIDTLPPGHVAVYQDEVDIHLNPKIGLDWMVCGQQKEVVTPGNNVKHYLAGAVDALTGQLVWVEGKRKNSALFVQLLEKLLACYPEAKVIHVILDNYRVHTSKITQWAVEGFAGKIALCFLPPYCPDDNKIERLWEDLHANVTRNHRCPDMKTLMREVRRWMRRRTRDAQQRYLNKAA